MIGQHKKSRSFDSYSQNMQQKTDKLQQIKSCIYYKIKTMHTHREKKLNVQDGFTIWIYMYNLFTIYLCMLTCLST